MSSRWTGRKEREKRISLLQWRMLTSPVIIWLISSRIIRSILNVSIASDSGKDEGERNEINLSFFFVLL